MIENIGAYSQVDYDRGYQQGRADLLESIRECAEHLGYDDIEDLLSYVNKKEQSNADTTQ